MNLEPKPTTLSLAQDESCIGAHLGERAPRGADEAGATVAAAPAAAATASDPAAHDSAAQRLDAGSCGRAAAGAEGAGGEGDPEVNLDGNEDGVSVASDASEGISERGQDAHAVGTEEGGPGGVGGVADDGENSGSAGASDAGEDDVRGTNAGSSDGARGSEAVEGSGLGSARSGPDAYEAFMDGAADPLRRHYQRCANDTKTAPLQQRASAMVSSATHKSAVCHNLSSAALSLFSKSQSR